MDSLFEFMIELFTYMYNSFFKSDAIKQNVQNFSRHKIWNKEIWTANDGIFKKSLESFKQSCILI